MEMRRGLLLVLVITFMGKSYAQMSEDSNSWTDQNFETKYEKTVTLEVTEIVTTVPVPAAPALFSHDCSGEQYEASVTLQLPISDTEEDTQANLSPAGDDFDTVIEAKIASVEGEVHLEKQFERLQAQLEKSGGLKDSIRAVVMEIESTIRVILAGLLQVHQSRPTPEVLEKPKSQIAALKKLYNRLAGVLQDSPALYYRYQGDWRGETQTVVSLLAFMHWLETGNLLLHHEAEEKLGCCEHVNNTQFGLDVEDYLAGLCLMSNELQRFVVNQVTAGDYDCPRKVLKFMTELHTAFRMLNLGNHFLLKKFDGMKHDLRRVEEVYYDVRIRGLSVDAGSTKVQSDKLELRNTCAA